MEKVGLGNTDMQWTMTGFSDKQFSQFLRRDNREEQTDVTE